MLIVTKYDVGDRVRCGPHEGRIMSITVSSSTTYGVGLWHEGAPQTYVAYEWELELIESMASASGREEP